MTTLITAAKETIQVVAIMRNLRNQNELKPVPTTVIHIPS